VPRREDLRLLTGRGRFVGTVRLPGAAHAVVVRSWVPHGRLMRCETAATRAAPGVLDVITPADAAGVFLPRVCLSPGQRDRSYPVLDTTVRYVGQPVAMVVAGTLEEAVDAAELLDLEFEDLPVVLGVEAALAADAPLLYPEWGTNLVTEFEIGDSAQRCEETIAGAAQLVELMFHFGRNTPFPLEPRGVVASDTDGDLTIWTSTQAPHHIRDSAAEALGRPHDRVRVISQAIGGGFGAKEHLYTDELLTCLAAVRLGRPVVWTESPSDRLAATLPAREAVHRARLALDADGRFLALHADIVGDLGARPSAAGASPVALTALALPGPYHFEHAGARVRGVVTTTTPTGSYRGFGQPEATWARERLIEEAARRSSMDGLELRMRNMIRPDELPYLTRTGRAYDSGDYPLALRTLRDLVRPPRRDDGRRRGVGYSCHVDATGMGPSMAMKAMGALTGGYETALARMEPDGSVAVFAGVAGIGQGIETTLSQLAADRIGVPLERVRVALGDTATAPYSGMGSVASRGIAVGGGAVVLAATKLRERLVAIAAHQLEVTAEDLEVAGETVRVKGDPQACRTFPELATSAWRAWDLPEGMAPGLEVRASYDPADFTYSYAVHAAAVAVDPETGAVELEGYWVVADSGVLVNPVIVEGQLRGGVVQGIGMALTEELAYTPDGQPLAEYYLPNAVEVPDVHVTLLTTPSTVTPGGMKGVGEAGTIGAPAAIGNAVAAALPEIAEHVTDTPISPQALWSHLNA
jgi:carbon-monoxide dehydrogenase large subunit